MKKIYLALVLILTTTSIFAAEPVSKNSYSKNMFLILECLRSKGLTPNYRLADLALDHCKSEAAVNVQIGMIYNNMPPNFLIDLDRYHSSTSDMIVCLGGVRGLKSSDDESVQKAKDRAAISECEELLIPVGGSALPYQFIQTQ